MVNTVAFTLYSFCPQQNRRELPSLGGGVSYFATGTAGVVDTGGKFAADVVDTGGAPWIAYISANLRKNSKWPYFFFRGLGEHGSRKKPEAKKEHQLKVDEKRSMLGWGGGGGLLKFWGGKHIVDYTWRVCTISPSVGGKRTLSTSWMSPFLAARFCRVTTPPFTVSTSIIKYKVVKVGKNLHTRWLDYNWFYSLKNNWRIFVLNIWWISQRIYYIDLLPHWRHDQRDKYNEYIFKYVLCTIIHKVIFLFIRTCTYYKNITVRALRSLFVFSGTVG